MVSGRVDKSPVSEIERAFQAGNDLDLGRCALDRNLPGVILTHNEEHRSRKQTEPVRGLVMEAMALLRQIAHVAD